MDVPRGLRTFDAFPKVESSYAIRSSRGGLVSLLCGTACLFLIWVELAYYLGGVEIQQFSVDKKIVQNVQVNIDITINIPCNELHVAGVDSVHDRLAARELLTFQGVDGIDEVFEHGLSISENAKRAESFQGVLRRARTSKFHKKKDVKGGPACRLYGSVDVTKVKGELYITGPRAGGNFSHFIEELSFGEYYPKLVNPLDGVVSISDNSKEAFQYFVSIVPTTYQSYSTGHTIETNQYAVTEEIGAKSYNLLMPPGIFFKYDFEPISLLITDKRLPFAQFLARLVSIVGGMVACFSWFYKGYDHIVTKTFKRKATVETTRGMLDGDQINEKF